MKPLDIHSFPLQGQSLIEASAGTGKTYTINQLYRRLILGHGDAPTEVNGRLGCTDILVVTFTKAATEELRGRIRSGLRDAFESILAAESLAVDHAENSHSVLSEKIPDKDIARWLKESGIPIKEQRDWLQVNLAQMDESSIFTIHRFCAQMLKRFAFDSGVGFNVAMETEGQEFLQRACEDVWRQTCYPETVDKLRVLTAKWKTPQALLAHFRSWTSKPDLTIQPKVEKNTDELWDIITRLKAQAREAWAALGSDGIDDLIFSADIDKRSYSKKHYPSWKVQIGDYLYSDVLIPIPKNLERFGSELLTAKTKSGEPPRHLLITTIDGLMSAVADYQVALEVYWFKHIYQHYIELLDQAAVMTSDDLLRLLDDALQSERGEDLAKKIRTLYPVAMIDEFQDTDPTQYRIFNTIYPAILGAENTEDTELNIAPGYGLIMIGDPKQAIYAFRGADIFTYMKARDQIPDERSFTLDTNYRSDSALISAVNSLWKNNDNPFLFKRHIQFHPVKSGALHDKQAPNWQCETPEAPLQIWIDGSEEESKREAEVRIADECAEQISAVLAGAATVSKGKKQTSLVAGDCAVLVYSRPQAALIRRALTAKHIGSVFLTRDSVFESNEAFDLLAILEAIMHPGNETGVRRALATYSWGMSAEQLAALQVNESAWENQLAAIHEYQILWQRRGIMALIMQWLADKGIESEGSTGIERAVRLRKQPDGERIITNILHLGEMLQTQSRKLRGHQALVRWLSERISGEIPSGEEAQLRLETDERLVNIVTIHKSKGLEYPMVFLPYLWADKAERHSKETDNTYYDGIKVVRDLAPNDDAFKLQQRDILAEKMRLLYVALTRAKFGCYLWLSRAMDGRTKKPVWPSSALGYLLGTDTEPLTLAINDVYIGPKPTWQAVGQNELEIPPQPVKPASAKIEWRDAWRVGSYSQLAAHSSSGSHSSTGANSSSHSNVEQSSADLAQAFDWEAGLDSVLNTRPSYFDINTAEVLPVALRFPKGANPGTCLHAIFEHWDFSDQKQLLEVCDKQLTLYGLAEQASEEVSQWVTDITQQVIPGVKSPSPFSLSQLETHNRLDEMEFYLPVGLLESSTIDALLGGDNRFQFQPLTGYLKGFIDLIFEWQGRYYIADYKSNYLGETAEEYQPGALVESMRDHKYDLQSWIYTIALDQMLSQRLPNYSPEKHLGGSLYLYLRGMGNHFSDAAPDSGICYTPVNIEQLEQWRSVLLRSLDKEVGV